MIIELFAQQPSRFGTQTWSQENNNWDLASNSQFLNLSLTPSTFIRLNLQLGRGEICVVNLLLPTNGVLLGNYLVLKCYLVNKGHGKVR